MFEFEVNDQFIIKQQQAIEAALSNSPEAEKVVRKVIRKYLNEAQKEVINGIQFANGDPRHANKAVRKAIYKKVLGGNLNILGGSKKADPHSYEPPRKLKSWQIGGNRMKRSENTQRIMSYGGKQRGFVLRFVNSGTKTRRGTGGGNRGAISPRRFFSDLGNRAIYDVQTKLEEAIAKELADLMKKKE